MSGFTAECETSAGIGNASTKTRGRSMALPGFAKFVAFCTFVLICAGALVTGNKAALSDPTWPKFVGQWFPTKETFVANLRYEDSHRIIAAATTLLALALVAWLQRTESRAWVRRLGWAAIGTIIIQAVLGGLVVLLFRQYKLSVVHACLGQIFFLLTVTIAVVTSPRWKTGIEAIQRPGNRSFYRQAKWALGIVFFQLILGAALRHTEEAFWVHLYFHIGTALLVIAAIVWLNLRAFGEYRDIPAIRRVPMVASVLLLVQVILGVFSIFANRARLEPEMPQFFHVMVSTAHVATGALILATMLVLCLRVRQKLAITPDADYEFARKENPA